MARDSTGRGVTRILPAQTFAPGLAPGAAVPAGGIPAAGLPAAGLPAGFPAAGVPAGFPAAGVPTAAALPLAAIQQFLTEGLPLTALAHSFHVDALLDPSIRANPVFQQFSLVELNELHHLIAAQGALLRIQLGDPGGLRSLGVNLAGFLQNRQAGLQLSAALPPAVRQNPAVQATLSLIQQTQQQVVQNLPIISQAIAVSGAPAPGPLLIGRPV